MESGLPFFEADGEAAFYGPKIDVQVKDTMGREETLSTIQADQHLPEQFKLEFKDSDDTPKRPVMILGASVTATVRVLPWQECPAAIGSAVRVKGMMLSELRNRVRAEFVGTSTCTHLNDLLRSLEDVRGMLPPAT